MAEIGTPVPIYDPVTQSSYLVLPAEFTPDPLGGYQATIPGLQAMGAGDTREDAVVALSVVLQGVLPKRS
jgi:hypothetical protein